MDDRASAELMEGSERKIWVMISVGSVSKYMAMVVIGGLLYYGNLCGFTEMRRFSPLKGIIPLLKLLLMD